MWYRALKYITLNCIINYQSKWLKLKHMHHIFKKNYNLIIKNFPSHIAVLYHLRVIRVKLCRTKKQFCAKFSHT